MVAILVMPPSLLQAQVVACFHNSDSGSTAAKPFHWTIPVHAACRLVHQPLHVEVGERPYMVLIHAKVAGVHVLFDMVVHSIHNIWHIRSHAAAGGVLCD